jgi:hypothetical protein
MSLRLGEIRAMDRRRFVPSPEVLEGRKLLSNILSASTARSTLPTSNLPNTPEQKATRIAHLPTFLEQIEPGRFLPKDTITTIQNEMTAVKGQLHSAPPSALDNFNHVIRAITPHETLSTDDARQLDQAFSSVLISAGATVQETRTFASAMSNLARVDSVSINPVILATNDYAIILQTTLGIGRPILTPTAPQLAPVDVVGGKGSHLTKVRTPHLVGTYNPGATMVIVDSTGVILGSGVVAKGGRYSAGVNQILPDGQYTVRVQAIDQNETSDPSPPYTFRVVSQAPKVPQGPLGP